MYCSPLYAAISPNTAALLVELSIVGADAVVPLADEGPSGVCSCQQQCTAALVLSVLSMVVADVVVPPADQGPSGVCDGAAGHARQV
jgi:hypothetical protein